MKKIVKITAVMLAALFVMAAAAGCGDQKDNPTVMIIGGEKVPLDEFNYFYYNTKADYDGGDESFWADTDNVAKLYSDVLFLLKRNRAIEDMAKEYGVKLDPQTKNSISQYISQVKKSYTDEADYYSSLEAEHMSERMFNELLQTHELWQKLFEHVTSEASGIILADDRTLLEDIPKNFYRATHILIMNDEGDDPAENKALAEQILSRIRAGEDFETLKEEYGEDQGVEGNTDGYYFTHGQMIQSFENAVKSLQLGEISDIVESVYGYHIIQRLPLEDEYIYRYLEELRDLYMARIFNEMLESKANSYEVTYTEAYHELDILPNPNETNS